MFFNRLLSVGKILPGQRETDPELLEIKKILTGGWYIDPDGYYAAREEKFYYNFAGIPKGFENAQVWGISKKTFVYYCQDETMDTFEEVVKVLERQGHPLRLKTRPRALCVYRTGGFEDSAVMMLENRESKYMLTIFMPKSTANVLIMRQIAASFEKRLPGKFISEKDLGTDYDDTE